MQLLAPLLLALALTLPAEAAPIVLDFEEEAEGLYVAGFVSSECACVLLYGIAPFGESLDPPEPPEPDLGLIVRDWGERSDGQAILVGHEGARLVMQFLIPVVGVSIDFGNDLPADELSQVSPLRDATLTGFDAQGGIVAHSAMTPNRDRIVNQTISISSDRTITRALFDFEQLGELEPEDFIVDNLVLTTVAGHKERVAVCHKGRILFLGGPALQAHLAHGDSEGACPVP